MRSSPTRRRNRREAIPPLRTSKSFPVTGFLLMLMSLFPAIGQSESTELATISADGAQAFPPHRHSMDLQEGELPRVGGLAPAFHLKTLEGHRVSLADYHGKVVILNFWATWCIPCRVEMPHFQELWQAHREEGFEVLGIAIDRRAKRVRKTLKELGVTYPIALISAIYEGFAYKEEYEAAIKPLLSQKAGGTDTK
ncbi:MAG: TlpA disulfide reductase family protein [Candidatus Binatia bacterium]